MTAATIAGHWPELQMGSHEFVVCCYCGSVFRDPDREPALSAWATHVAQKIDHEEAR